MGTFSVIALTVNILVGAAVAVTVHRFLSWRESRRKPQLYVGEPKEGGRGQWWTGIFDRAGRRIWQTAPPGHSSRGEALRHVDLIRQGRIGKR